MNPVRPTPDTFRALARSSPWLWRTLHFKHRDDRGEVEAWVRRPGELLVRQPGEADEYVSGLPYTYSSVIASDGGVVPDVTPHLVPQEVVPVLRPDGLVAERPSSRVDYDDPMWQSYSWVAMLDPVELSHHVRVDGLREEEVAGRPAWRGFVVAEPGYAPRCGGNCCELLYSEAGLMSDFDDPSEVPEGWRGRRYPDGYDVALDVQTGVVVRCHPVGGDVDAPWLENDVLEVDADTDAVFVGRGARGGV
jgi:hypothetical protein